MSDTKRVVEINGTKFEVDLRNAKVVDELRVGSKVKVMIDAGYNSHDYKVYPGVVAGFEEFKAMPTIVIVYLEVSYSEAKIKFLHYNEKTEKTEVIPSYDDTDLMINKGDVLSKMDNEILKKEEELDDLNRRKNYFLNHFNKYFSEIELTTEKV